MTFRIGDEIFTCDYGASTPAYPADVNPGLRASVLEREIEIYDEMATVAERAVHPEARNLRNYVDRLRSNSQTNSD